MTIQEAIQQYRDLGQNNDPDFDPVIRLTSWEHGRILIPGKLDLYVRIVGKFPMLPTPIELNTDEIMSTNWEVTTLAKMLEQKEEKRAIRTGRRKQIEA